MRLKEHFFPPWGLALAALARHENRRYVDYPSRSKYLSSSNANDLLSANNDKVARPAALVLDRGVQADARGAARCLLHVLGRSAKTEACGRSFAILSTQVSTVGLRLRHNRLTCGIMPPKRVRSPSDATCSLQRCPKNSKGCWFAAWRSTGLYILRTQKIIIVASKQPEGTSPPYSFGLPKSENMPGSAAALMWQRRMSSYPRLM